MWQPDGTFKLTSVTNSGVNMEQWNMPIEYHVNVTIFLINLLRS